MPQVERTVFMAHAVLGAFQSDPSARLVQATANPLVPYLQGSFDLKRAMQAAIAAGDQWDAADAQTKAAAQAALEAAKPAEGGENGGQGSTPGT